MTTRYDRRKCRPAALPQPRDRPDRAVALVEGSSGPLGAIVYDAALDLEPVQVRMAVAAARSGLETIRQHQGLRAQVGELEASRSRIQAAAEAGRRRIERGIHDGVQQRLVVISMLIASLEGRVDQEGLELLAQARAQLQLVRDELREVARDIYPAILDQLGLRGAVESRVAPMRIPVSVEVEAEPCSRATRAVAYSVVCEALNNIARHSRASSAVVRASRVDGRLAIEVQDDGVGGADPHQGSGLVGLMDQVMARGGRLRVESPAGRGTTLHAELPCE